MEKIRFDVVGLYHWDVRNNFKEYAAEAVGKKLTLQPQPENVKDPYAVREIEDFVRWSYQYDMWCKMWIFGEKMRHAMELDKAVLVPGRRNLMEFLQDTFTIDELNTVRRAQGMKGDGAALLRKWLSRGYCTFNPATQQYTKSPQFLEKHQKAA